MLSIASWRQPTVSKGKPKTISVAEASERVVNTSHSFAINTDKIKDVLAKTSKEKSKQTGGLKGLLKRVFRASSRSA